MTAFHPLLSALLSAALAAAASVPSCEAPLSGIDYPAYVFGPDIVGCFGTTCMPPNIPGTSGYNTALAPLSYNATAVPYCQARCINPHATDEQVNSLAVPCQSFCSDRPAAEGTIENTGWCLYWCVAGRQEVIASMSCADSIPYHYQTITIGTDVETPALLGTAIYTDIGNAASHGADNPATAVMSSASATTVSSSMATSVAPAGSEPPPQSPSAATATVGPSGSAQAAAAGQSEAAVSTSKSKGQRIDLDGGSLAAMVVGLLAGVF